MTTMHKDSYRGDNAYFFRTGNITSTIYYIKTREEAREAFIDHIKSFKQDKTNSHNRLKRTSARYIASLPHR